MASWSKIPRIAIVGPAGSGKSATGNTLLQEQIFATTPSANSDSTGVRSARGTEKFPAFVIDTPALPNTEEGKCWMKDEMEKCIASATKNDVNGIDAILLTLDGSIGFTEESERAVEALRFFFGDDFEKWLIVVFTRAEKEKLVQNNNYLDTLIQNCNNRVFHFNNEEKNPEIKYGQLPCLITAVNELQEKNDPLLFDHVSRHDTKHPKSRKGKSGASDAGPQKTETEVGMNTVSRTRHSAVDETLVIAIIGPAGSGKSATGNTILGRNAFVSKRSMAITTKSMTPKERVEPRKIIVIDTPPLLDTCLELTCEKLAREFDQCIIIAKKEANGLDAIVLTINANGRFTEEIINGIEFARNFFGEKFVKFLIIIFTREDQFSLEDFDLEQSLYSDDTPNYLKKLFEACNNRVLTINNKAGLEENDTKVKQIT